jgi:hypothetical protein
VLLFFLSKKFVSTKWRIEKGILVGPRLLRQEFRAVAGSANCFSTEKFAKDFISGLKMEKKFGKLRKSV